MINDQAPWLTFIIPAYQAEATLDRTLASIAAQTSPHWHVIIVDDGSTDDTIAIARRWSAKDPRVRVIENAHHGVSHARNTGIEAAQSDWLVFLDADDTISNSYLRVMRDVWEESPLAQILVCGFDRLDASGRVSARMPVPRLDENPIVICREGPPAAIHCFTVQRAAVNSVGGFDETLRTSEDWDLWLRLAGHGARFATTNRRLSQYWATPHSLSSDGSQLLADSKLVLERAQRIGADSLTDEADPEETVFTDQEIADRVLRSAFWSAGVAIGQGSDTARFLDLVSERADWRFQKDLLVAKFLDGLVVGSGVRHSALILMWVQFLPGIEAFLALLGRKFGSSFGSFAIMLELQLDVARAGRFKDVRHLGLVTGLPISIRILRSGYRAPEGTEMVVLRNRWLRPSTIFSFQTPAFDGLAGRDLRGAILRGFGRKAATAARRSPRLAHGQTRLRRMIAMARRVIRAPRAEPPGFPAKGAGRDIAAALAQAIAPNIASLPRKASPISVAAHPATGADRDQWEAFFQTEDPWGYGSAYEQVKYQRTIGLIEHRPAGRALELACAEGRFTAMLAPLVDELLAVDISQTALDRAARRNEGARNIRFAQRDFFALGVEGTWDLIVCSEVLYYLPSVENLQRLAQSIAGALAPGGRFVQAHAFQAVDSPGRTAFDWDDSFGVQTIHDTFADQPGLRLVRSIVTDLYRIDLFEASDDVAPPVEDHLPLGAELEPAVAGNVLWNGAILTRAQAQTQRVFEMPILMLPPLATDDAAQTSPYDLTAQQLAHQLRFLRRRGYRSVTPTEWTQGASMGGSLRGRPLMLTFDGAHRSFAETAWPIIRNSGFAAHMFVPTGRIGTDSGTAALMDWEMIAALAAEGVTFGSQLTSGTAADMMQLSALMDEAVRSRITLEHVTGGPINTIAPPHGINDTRIEQVLAGAGYSRAFIGDGAMAPICGFEMRTPRIEIVGDFAIEDFASAIGRDDEPAEQGDLP